MRSLKITAELTEEEVGVIKRALDLYTRIFMGQVEELESVLRMHIPYDKNRDLGNVRDAIQTIKSEYFNLNGAMSYGISSDKTLNISKKSYDILQVFRNATSWALNPKGNHTVDFDEPMRFSSTPLPKIEAEEL